MNYTPPKIEKISFGSVKDRKNFITDIATLRIAISLIDVSLQGDDFNGEIKTFHKNKNRKELKEANEYLDKLKELLFNIHEETSLKDIKTTIWVSEQMFQDMVSISDQYTNISLAHVAMYLVKHKLDRKGAFKILEVFNRTWGIKRVIRIFENNGITANGKEEEMAIKLCDKIKSIYR